MIYEGKAYRFGDNINTDFIISGRYKFSVTDMAELSRHLFEDIRPGFYDEIKPDKSIIVAGHNFGMGSSREQAPWVIKEAKVLCVVAKSFARIFYRNAFNIGLGLIEADTTLMKEAHLLKIDLEQGLIEDTSIKRKVKFNPWGKFQLELINNNGIVNYLEKYKDFKI